MPRYAALFGITLLASCAFAACAADGDLDPTFGIGGVVEIAWPSGAAEANAVGIDANGRIVVGGDAIGAAGDGDFTLLRLLPDGSMDTSFASDAGGFRQVNFDLAGIGGRSNDKINDLAVLGDGSTVALGEAHFGLGGINSQYALVKTDTNGDLDATFNSSGTAHFGFNTFQAIDQGQLIRVDTLGRILVAGTVAFELNNNPALVYWAGIARVTETGQIDHTFYGSGLYDTPIWADKSTSPATKTSYSFPSSLLLDSSQRIVVTATIEQPFPQAVALMRAPPDGGYDPNFGTQGTGRVLLTPTLANASATWPLANGRLMVSGTYGNSTPDTPFLMRLNEDGSVDNTFAGNGLASLSPLDSGHFAVLNFLSPTKTGGWLLAGQYGTVNGSTYQNTGVILIRFDANGNPDASFGNNGIVAVIPDPARSFTAQHAAMQPDGKLVIAGSFPNSATNSTPHFAVIRILADYDTIFANGFEASP